MSWDPNPAQRKLLFAGIVVALAAIGVYLTAPSLFGRHSRDPSSTTREGRIREPVSAGEPGSRDSPSAMAPDTASPRSSPPDVAQPTPTIPPSEAPYAKTVLRFTRAFTDTDRSADAWHKAVARYCTPALAEALSYTAPRAVPEGKPTGDMMLVQTGDNVVQVAVPLDSGRRILVTVTSVGEGYEVSDVRPGDRA